MRLRKLIKGDVAFQIKYGFYFVYAIMTLLYILLLYAIPAEARKKALVIVIYTDPAALGIFFMGAIILLEKSQRVLNSIAVSPVKVSEYIISKAISLSFISTLVGLIISIAIGSDNLIQIGIGTLIGSIIFSLLGLMIAAKINTLNQFTIATVPMELICFLPPILYLFGFRNPLMLLHPGCVIISLLEGNSRNDSLSFLILFLWVGVLFLLSRRIIHKMFQSVGGVKL